MLQIVLLAGKFVFLIILYLFIYRVIRSTHRELRAAAPGPAAGVPAADSRGAARGRGHARAARRSAPGRTGRRDLDPGGGEEPPAPGGEAFTFPPGRPRRWPAARPTWTSTWTTPSSPPSTPCSR